MDLCSNNHEEVCYEGRVCPACQIRDEMQETINQHEARIKDLEDELSSVE